MSLPQGRCPVLPRGVPEERRDRHAQLPYIQNDDNDNNVIDNSNGID